VIQDLNSEMGHPHFINIGKGETESEGCPVMVYAYGMDFPA
jgi:hypothetical protein